MNIERGRLQKLHDLTVAVYEELHRLDGTETLGYTLFKNPEFEEAAKLNHLMYSQAVTATQKSDTPNAGVTISNDPSNATRP